MVVFTRLRSMAATLSPEENEIATRAADRASPGYRDGSMNLTFLAAAPTRPSRGLDHLHCETVVPVPLERAFAFFADAANLEALTPPWLRFRILTPMPVVMRPGAEIDYRITLYGIPIPWRSRIDVWEPGVRFVDRELVGPYWWWYHEHRFEAATGGTRVVDHVEYVARARWVSSGFVRRDLDRIFTHRRHMLGRLLGNE